MRKSERRKFIFSLICVTIRITSCCRIGSDSPHRRGVTSVRHALFTFVGRQQWKRPLSNECGSSGTCPLQFPFPLADMVPVSYMFFVTTGVCIPYCTSIGLSAFVGLTFRSVRRILVMGSMPPCCRRRRKF